MFHGELIILFLNHQLLNQIYNMFKSYNPQVAIFYGQMQFVSRKLSALNLQSPLNPTHVWVQSPLLMVKSLFFMVKSSFNSLSPGSLWLNHGQIQCSIPRSSKDEEFLTDPWCSTFSGRE